jgi:hypothetical protein
MAVSWANQSYQAGTNFMSLLCESTKRTQNPWNSSFAVSIILSKTDSQSPMSTAFAALNLSMAQLPLGHGSKFTQPSLVVPMFVSFRADKQQKEIISRSRNRL